MPDFVNGRPVTEVAVGVLFNPQTGEYLLGSRPEGKPYAGYWEFPGGKLEKGETVHQALVRELREELGLEIGPSTPWFVMEHDYPHAYVRLHFRRVHTWQGQPRGLEHQLFSWFTKEHCPMGMKLLPMDALVICRIFLPQIVAAVANPANEQESVARLKASHAQAVLVEGENDPAVKLAAAAGIPFLDMSGGNAAWVSDFAGVQQAAASGAIFAAGKVSAQGLLADERNGLPVYLPGTSNELEGMLQQGAQGVVVAC